MIFLFNLYLSIWYILQLKSIIFNHSTITIINDINLIKLNNNSKIKKIASCWYRARSVTEQVARLHTLRKPNEYTTMTTMTSTTTTTTGTPDVDSQMQETKTVCT